MYTFSYITSQLEVFREEWLRSIESDRTSILSSKQDWCRPNTLRSDVSSMLYACIVHDAVYSSRSYQDPCDSCPWDPQAESLSVVQIFTSRYQSRIDDGMQIDCTSDMTNALEEVARITTLSCRVGSIRLRPEWPWRARRYTIIPEESLQYGIFSCFLLLLPCSSSTCRQTNEDSTGNVSEDSLSFSRTEPLHHLLDVFDFHDEEDEINFFDMS